MAALPSAQTEVVTVDTPVVACEGNNGNGLGHPKVYLAFGPDRRAVCPYCSRTFVLAEGAKAGHGH